MVVSAFKVGHLVVVLLIAGRPLGEPSHMCGVRLTLGLWLADAAATATESSVSCN